MNEVTLIGRLARDVEVSNSKGGTPVARCTIAVNRIIKKEGQPSADFINLLMFGKTADLAGHYLKKGNRVGVNGRIQVNVFENEQGQKQYFTEVVVSNLEFLESKPKQEAAPKPQPQQPVNIADDYFPF